MNIMDKMQGFATNVANYQPIGIMYVIFCACFHSVSSFSSISHIYLYKVNGSCQWIMYHLFFYSRCPWTATQSPTRNDYCLSGKVLFLSCQCSINEFNIQYLYTHTHVLVKRCPSIRSMLCRSLSVRITIQRWQQRIELRSGSASCTSISLLRV